MGSRLCVAYLRHSGQFATRKRITILVLQSLLPNEFGLFLKARALDLCSGTNRAVSRPAGWGCGSPQGSVTLCWQFLSLRLGGCIGSYEQGAGSSPD